MQCLAQWSGRCVVVPHGAMLTQQSGYCTATSGDGTVIEAVYGQSVTDMQNLATVSAYFELLASAP
jgi:hypothetical protein